jgi:hypothetical protein
VQQNLGGAVDVELAAAQQAAAPAGDRLQQCARLVGDFVQLVADLERPGITLDQKPAGELRYVAGFEDGVADATGGGQAVGPLLIVQLRPQHAGRIIETHADVQSHPLLAPGHRRSVLHLGDFSALERIDQGRLADVGDAHDHGAHRLSGLPPPRCQPAAECGDALHV